MEREKCIVKWGFSTTSLSMNRSIFLILILLLVFFSCATSSDTSEASTEIVESQQKSPYPGPPEIYDLLKKWELATRTRDVDLFTEIMPIPWIRYNPESGEEISFHSMDSAMAFRFDFFDRLGPYQDYSLPELGEYEFHKGILHCYHFEHPVEGKESTIKELIEFLWHEDRWIIDNVSYIIFKDGAFVTNHLAAQADTDDDGFLTDTDDRYGGMMFDLLWEPHKNNNYIDEFFDSDKNGSISEFEIKEAAEILIGKGFRFASDAFGYYIEEYDFNGNELIDDDEIEEMIKVITDLSQPDSKRLPIMYEVHWFPMPDYLFQNVPREVSTYIDQLADGNEDSLIDEIEQRIIDTGFTMGHEVAHYFDRLLDRNKDGDVNWNELFIVLQASAKGWGNIILAPPPYPTHTPTDRLLDVSGDALIDEDEIKTHVILFSGQPAAANFISAALKELLDINKNNEVDEQEIQKIKAAIFYPRQVDPGNPLDIKSDVDENGFLDVLEIGILAGRTAGTPITHFDDRIDLYRQRENFEQDDSKLEKIFLNNKEKVENKRLAVLDVEIGLSSLSKEITNIITIFMENAFVNIGSVNLVERRNLDKLYDELNFQLSGMVDENSAVEIGQMSGADVIAVGEINELEGRYFLNIKLIAVETAEIIGSSISQTEGPEGFLDLANQAVNKLF